MKILIALTVALIFAANALALGHVSGFMGITYHLLLRVWSVVIVFAAICFFALLLLNFSDDE